MNAKEYKIACAKYKQEIRDLKKRLQLVHVIDVIELIVLIIIFILYITK